METEKDDVIECVIEDMGVYGEGITHVGGQTVFIPNAIRGERVSARVVLAKPTFAHAVLLKVLTPSPSRISPPCPYFKQCGGCSLQHVGYEEQLRLKRDIVVGALKKYAALTPKVDEVVPSDEIYRYRNKLSLPVRTDGKGNAAIGFFMKRSHRIVPIEDCMLQKSETFAAAKAAFGFALDSGLTCYDESSGKGVLRHIIVRSLSGELSVTYVLTARRAEFERALVAALESKGRQNLSVFINYNSRNNNVILGDKTVLVFGGSTARIGDMTVDTHPQAFFQVNDNIRDKLYAAVKSEIDEDTGVVDAYCGAGIMSAMLAEKAGRVIGVEISAAAVASAEGLKRRMNLGNLSFINGDCAQSISVALEGVKDCKRICAVLDPPKSGCDESVLKTLVEAGNADKIVYVSCNPATLARDSAVLVGGGYSLSSVRPFDMFPQTTSVETLAVFTRN